MRRALRIATRILVVAVAAAALVTTGVGWSLQRNATAGLVTSEAVADAPPVRSGEAFTALLVGLDARTDANGNALPRALLDALHVGPDAGELHTDTIILLHVPAAPRSAAVAVSIPRDSYVDLADGSGKHKINSAYGRAYRDREKALTTQGVTGAALDQQGREAGRAALVATVQKLTGVRIDHFAEINFAGFVDLTEALGGVPVCLNAPASDSYSGIDLPAGPQVVNGPAALAFVRQRHGLDGGDLDRIARQQAFIAGLAQRLQTTDSLTDPGRLGALVGIATRYVVIDRGWDLDQAVAQVGLLSGEGLTFRTIPTGRPDLRTPSDGVAVQIDPVAVKEFVGGLMAESDGTAAPTSAPTVAPTTAPAAAVPTATARPVITAGGVPCVD
jgi:LCP family protein required for cell wall assembly